MSEENRYPSTKDTQFNSKIASKKEFKDHISKKSNKSIEELCSKLNAPVLFEYQKLLRNYMSPATPYQNGLLYALAGTGKTISSIAIAETHIPRGIKVYVLLEDSVRQNFYDEYKMYTGKDLDKRKIKVQTLGKFTNVISGLLKTASGRKEIKSLYSNALIIIDEVHNIRENTSEDAVDGGDSSFKRYNAVKSILSLGTGNKLLLMSATPMYDNPREIVSLINLFLVNTKETEIDVNTVFDGLKLTSRGENIIREKLRGIVSHVRPDINTYPSMSFPNDAVSYPFLKGADIRIIDCKMSERHELYYRDNINDHINVVRQNSNVIGTDTSVEQMNESKLKDKKSSISIKFYKLLKSLKEDEGSAFIYSEFISGSLEKIKDILLANGFDEYNPKKVTKNPTFIFLDGGLSLTQRTSLIDTFNTVENKDGKIIKVVLGSRVLKEGITLKNVRHVHIMEPWHNISRLQQIWGRAIRACSHVALSKTKRNVLVHLYASTFNNGTIPSTFNYSDFATIKDTIPYDIIGYYRSAEKQIYIEKIIHVLREIAFDCLLNKDINNNTKDGVQCDGDTPDEDTDTSTYIHNTGLFEEPEVTEMIVSIRKILTDTKLYKIPSNPSSILKKAIKSLIDKDPLLILRGKYIIVNPKGLPKETPFYTKLTKGAQTRPKIPFSNKYVSAADHDESNMSRQPTPRTASIIAPSPRESTVGVVVKNNIVKGKYRGILKDNGVFLLQDTTMETKVGSGRECKSFVGKDLHSIIENIGIPAALLESQIQGSAFKSKGKICEIIKTFYYPEDTLRRANENSERELVGYKFRLKTINNVPIMTIADTTKLDKGGVICLTMKTESLRKIASLLGVGTPSTGRKDLCELIQKKVF